MENKAIYQWSIKLNNGEIYVVHADTFSDLQDRIKQVREVLDIEETVSSPVTATEAANKTQNAPVTRDKQCEKCGSNDFWVNTVKKDSPNKGREFYICKSCKAFNGFLD